MWVVLDATHLGVFPAWERVTVMLSSAKRTCVVDEQMDGSSRAKSDTALARGEEIQDEGIKNDDRVAA